jgi:hypothetical protein
MWAVRARHDSLRAAWSAPTFVRAAVAQNGYTHSMMALFSVNRNARDAGARAKAYTAIHDVGGGSKEQRAAQNQEMVNQVRAARAEGGVGGGRGGMVLFFLPLRSTTTW